MLYPRLLGLSILFFLPSIPACKSGGGGSPATPEAPAAIDEEVPVVESFTPPLNVQAISGTNVTFQVAARQTSQYLWRVDGQTVPEAGPAFILLVEETGSTRTIEVTLLNDSDRFTVLVWKLDVVSATENKPPCIDLAVPTGPVDLEVGESIELKVKASDPDAADVLTYAWSIDGVPQASDGPTLVLASAALAEGDHDVEVTVTDRASVLNGGVLSAPNPNGNSVTQGWKVHVGKTRRNRAPIIASVSPPATIRVVAGSSLDFRVQAEDPDGDPLTYKWFVKNLQRSETGTSLRLVTSVTDPDLVQVEVIVEDGRGGQAMFQWQVTVEKPEPPPPTPVIVWNPVAVDVIGKAESLAGYRVYYGATAGSHRLLKDVGNVTEATLSGLPSGLSYVVVSAYDKSGNEGPFSSPPLQVEAP
jgi:hypothetical protein